MSAPLWYVKKSDGSVFGPAGVDALREWAAAGRVDATDWVSTDRSRWRPAADIPEFELNWSLELESGERQGPFHLNALDGFVRDGRLPVDAAVTHLLSGETLPLADALRRTAAPDAPVSTPAGPPPASVAAGTVASPSPLRAGATAPAAATTREPLRWSELALAGEQFQKEARHWRELFEREQAENIQQQQTAEARAQALTQELIALQTERDQMRRQIRRMEQDRSTMAARLQRPEDRPEVDDALWAFHLDLSRQFDVLAEQMSAQLGELQRARAQLAETRRESEECLRRLEDRLRAEDEQNREARQRTDALELAYRDLVRSFRDLNDRFIRSNRRAPPDAAPPRS